MEPLGVRQAAAMPKFTRVICFDKRMDKILLLAPYKLLFLLQRIKKHGEGIVQPQDLFDDIEAVKIDCANDSIYGDFKGIFLNSVQEAVVLPHGVVFVLCPDRGLWEYVLVNDNPLKVDELTYSAYSDFRKGIMNASMGVGIASAVVLPPHGGGSSTLTRPKPKKRQKQ
ncbi:sucrose synthase [Ranunculus cassubicifolius]